MTASQRQERIWPWQIDWTLLAQALRLIVWGFAFIQYTRRHGYGLL